jgi:hypothetical protein
MRVSVTQQEKKAFYKQEQKLSYLLTLKTMFTIWRFPELWICWSIPRRLHTIHTVPIVTGQKAHGFFGGWGVNYSLK